MQGDWEMGCCFAESEEDLTYHFVTYQSPVQAMHTSGTARSGNAIGSFEIQASHTDWYWLKVAVSVVDGVDARPQPQAGE